METSELIFISYSHRDRSFARRLQLDLEANGFRVWLDEKDILPGESIVGKIESGLRDSKAFLLVLSSFSVASNWLVREYQSALSIQLGPGRGSPIIIPLLLDKCDVPALLSSVKWVDFRDAYNPAITELMKAMRRENPEIRSSRILEQFDQLDEQVQELVSYVTHTGDREIVFPSHEFFSKAEKVENSFRRLRRWAIEIEPLVFDRRRWIIYGTEHLPPEKQTYDTESYPTALLALEAHRFCDTVRRFREECELTGVLSFRKRKYFGASGGSKGKTWYMTCHGRGIFRRAPYRGAKPYVTVGSKVDASTILCRIEMGNTDYEMLSCIGGGYITEIPVEDGAMIDKDTVLFRGSSVPSNRT